MLKKKIALCCLLVCFIGFLPNASYAQKTIKGVILKENTPIYPNSIKLSDTKKNLILNEYLINNLNFNPKDIQLFNILLTKDLNKIAKPSQITDGSNYTEDTRIYNIKLTRTPEKPQLVAKVATPQAKASGISNVNAFIKNGNFAQAETCIDKLPKNTIAQKVEAASLYESIQKRGKALKLYETVAAQTPNRIEFLYLYSLCLVKNNQNPKALSVLSSINKINPDFMLAYYTKGNIYFTQKDYINALKCFKTALILNPLSSDTSYNMGLTLESLGYKTLAVKFYTNCVKLNPQDKEALFAAKRLATT